MKSKSVFAQLPFSSGSRRAQGPLRVGALAAAVAACAPAQASAFEVTWNVGSLSLANNNDPTNLMYLDLQLTDGTNTGDGNSSVKISDLTITGGTFATALPDIGNVSYLSSGAVFLTDGDGSANAVADHALGFIPTSTNATISFEFSTSASSYDTPPDYFSVALLQDDESMVLTDGPTQREFLGYEFTSDPTNLPQTYRVNPEFAEIYSMFGDDRFEGLGEPTFLAVPDPAPFSVVSLGIVSLAVRRRRRS